MTISLEVAFVLLLANTILLVVGAVIEFRMIQAMSRLVDQIDDVEEVEL